MALSATSRDCFLSRQMLNRLASTHPTTLACMHGSAWTGDGAALLSDLAGILDQPAQR